IGYENIYVSGGSSTNKVMEIEFNNGDKTLYTDIHAQAGRFYEQKKTTQNCVVGMGKAINLRQLKNQFPD
uniref:hypothetical protein n=1 Tax=Vibrio cholerae TaxID=666 RepID=UPI00166D4A82